MDEDARATDEDRPPTAEADATATDTTAAEAAAEKAATTPRGGESRARPARLADIAARTGLATSTVSRALTRPGRVHAATRARVEQAARELDYVPNRAARALNSGRTGSIAVLVSDVTNPFYFGILRGTARQSRAAGLLQLLVDLEESGELEDALLGRLRHSVDGAVLAASRLPDRALAALDPAMPVVVLNRRIPGVPSVVIDTPGGVGHAVEHLVSLGHRSIAYAAGRQGVWSNEQRWRALARAAARLGARAVRLGPFPTTRWPAGAAAADAALNARVTACIAFNDVLAIGMLRRLSERGVDVPGELSVVGCDDIFGADFCSPPLTTIAAPLEDAGRLGVSMLVARLRPDPPAARAAVLPAQLVIRSSTGPAPRAAG